MFLLGLRKQRLDMKRKKIREREERFVILKQYRYFRAFFSLGQC